MKLYDIVKVFEDSFCDVIVCAYDFKDETEEHRLSNNDCFSEIYKGDISDIPIYMAHDKVLRAYIEDAHTISILVDNRPKKWRKNGKSNV